MEIKNKNSRKNPRKNIIFHYSKKSILIKINYMLPLLLLSLLLKDVSRARLGESDQHPISPKTPAPQYLLIKEKREREI